LIETNTSVKTSQPYGGQSEGEEDKFMPTTAEVVVTLLAMRSRQLDADDRGDKVGSAILRNLTEVLSCW
jgi:hypothetical protein